MKRLKTDSVTIQDKLAPLISEEEKIWQPKQGIGSFLTFELGAKATRKSAEIQCLKRAKKYRRHPLPDRGVWHFWIYMCAWRIEKNDKILAGAEDSRSRIGAALKSLDGQRLTSVNIVSPFLDTLFTFENSLKLRTFSRDSQEDGEHWMLFTPDDNVLALGPGASWSYHKSSEPRPYSTGESN